MKSATAIIYSTCIYYDRDRQTDRQTHKPAHSLLRHVHDRRGITHFTLFLSVKSLHIKNFIKVISISNKKKCVSRLLVTPVFLFLNIFKLTLEERHLACGFKCTPRN